MARPAPSAHRLDLRGIRCPLSWAKARVHLETLGRGTEIHLLVDDPQGARDIPRAAEAAGYHLIGVDADDGTWCIRLEV